MRCRDVVRLLQDEDGSLSGMSLPNASAAPPEIGTPPTPREARHPENAFFFRGAQAPLRRLGQAPSMDHEFGLS